MNRFSEWISKFSPVDIDALKRSFLSEEQIMSLKLYNEALSEIRSEKTDEALSLVKEAVLKNPDFTEAKTLLGILYFLKEDRERAEKILDEVIEEEKFGATAAIYGELTKKNIAGEKAARDVKSSNTRQIVLKVNEQRDRYDPAIRYATGIIAGLAVAFMIGLPSIFGSKDNSELAAEKTAYYESRIEELTVELDDYKERIIVEQSQIENYKDEIKTFSDRSSNLEDIIEIYKAEELFSQRKYEETADILLQLKDNNLDFDYRQRYEQLLESVMHVAADLVFNNGYNMFQNADYKSALEKFLKVGQYMPDYARMDIVIYYIGKAYIELKEYSKAVEAFEEVIERFPGGEYAGYSQRRIQDINRISN